MGKDALLTPLGTTYSEPSKDLEELEEVHLITSVLCLIAAHDFSSVKGDGDVGLPDSSVRGFEVSAQLTSEIDRNRPILARINPFLANPYFAKTNPNYEFQLHQN